MPCLVPEAVWGRDADVRGDGREVSTVLGMSQLDWVTPWHFLIPSVRVEAAWFFGDDGGVVPSDARQAIVTLTALVRANVRHQMEGHVDLVRQEPGEERDYAAIILDASFRPHACRYLRLHPPCPARRQGDGRAVPQQ